MRYALAIVIVAGIAYGQLAGHGSIAGMVSDASSGEPVRKAIVTLTLQMTPRAWATARTDGSGQFKFEGLPAGKYDLRAGKAGMGNAVYGAGSGREVGELIVLGDGEAREGLKLRIIAAGSIAGRVVDSDGDPVRDAQVTLLRTGRNLGERILVHYRGANTDDRGEYRMDNIGPGRYYLQAMTPPANEGPDEMLDSQFYGDARDWRESKAVIVRSGANLTGLDFHLRAEQPHPIRGRVTGVPDLGPPPKPPEPVEGIAMLFSVLGPDRSVDVSVSPLDGFPHQWSSGAEAAPPDYRFDLGNLAGDKYRIEARIHDGKKLWAASQLIDSRQPLGEILLDLAPAIDVKGRVQIEGGTLQQVGGVQVALVRPGWSPDENYSATIGADGSFALEQVPAGEWALNLTFLPGPFLKSATLGDRDVGFARFSIGPEAARQQLNIVVSTRTAAIDGQLDSGSSDVKRAGIVIAPVGKFHNFARFYQGAVTDDEGKFQMKNLAPGKYKIFALEKTAPVDFENPEAADQLNPLGEEIELTEGATLEVHPKLIPMDKAAEASPEGLQK